MKKLLSTLLGSLVLLTASLFPVTASQGASITDWWYKTYDFKVGDTIYLDLGCSEPNTTSVTFTTINLPPSLSYSSVTGVVSGTVEEAGSYSLSGEYRCEFGDGGALFTTTFANLKVAPLVTPAPYVNLSSLDNVQCSAKVIYLFPETPDVDSTLIEISNQAGTTLSIRRNSVPPRQIITEVFAITDLNDFGDNPEATTTGDTPFACGDFLSITISYSAMGSATSQASATNVEIKSSNSSGPQGSQPYLKLIPLGNKTCEFKVLGKLPSPALPGSVMLDILSTIDQQTTYTFGLNETVDDLEYEFTVNPDTDLISESMNSSPAVLSNTSTGTGETGCSSEFEIRLSYQDLNGGSWTTTKNVIATGSARVAMAVSQVSGQKCTVNVVVPADEIADGTWLQLTDPTTGNRDAGIELQGGAVEGNRIDARISLTTEADSNSSQRFTDVEVSGISCGGTWLVELVDPSAGVLYSKDITLVPQLPVCNAGTVISMADFSCVSVPKGFYNKNLSTFDSTACPTGMTTQGTGSTSVNDCYKPIVQVITGFKAPKAMKFGSVTNLAITTNTKALAKYKVTGPCKAKVASIVTKVKGKKITTKTLKVTASKKAGNCSVSLTSLAKDKHLAMSKPVKIKVSKSGK